MVREHEQVQQTCRRRIHCCSCTYKT